MWWSHVKSCEVKETCGEQEIRSEQVWTTLSCNNDWQSISIYATMCLVKQFLWANVWQIYWIPLALSWHFCDFCLLLGHNASIEEKLVEVLNLGFDWCRPLGQGSRGQLVRGTSRGSVEVSELSAKKSEIHEALVAELPSFATAWALESQVWAAKNHWTNFWFEFFKIFLFVRSEILSLLVLLYRIQWHAITTFFTRIFFGRTCDDVVRTSREGRVCDFVGLCATTATCSGGGPKLTLHTENHLVCCVGTTFIGDIRQDFNHLYSPSIPHAFIHFSIWSWFR